MQYDEVILHCHSGYLRHVIQLVLAYNIGNSRNRIEEEDVAIKFRTDLELEQAREP